MNKYNLGKDTQRTVAALPACTRQSRSSRTTTRACIYQTGRDPCRNTHPPSKKKENEVSNHEHKLSNKTTNSLLDRPIPNPICAKEKLWKYGGTTFCLSQLGCQRTGSTPLRSSQKELLPKPNTAAACHAITSCAYFFFFLTGLLKYNSRTARLIHSWCAAHGYGGMVGIARPKPHINFRTCSSTTTIPRETPHPRAVTLPPSP